MSTASPFTHDPLLAASPTNRGQLYEIEGRYAEARPLFKRALDDLENAFGVEDHPVAHRLNQLARVYQALGKDAKAEQLLKRALAAVERALGPNHPEVTYSLSGLAQLYRAQGKYAEAELLLNRVLTVLESARGRSHFDEGVGPQGRLTEAR